MSVIDDITAGTWPSLDDPALAQALTTYDAPAGSITIPGIPPILLTIADDLSALWDVLQIVNWLLEFGDAVNPIFAVINLILIIIEQLIPLFIGRPRQEATLNCAQNLLNAKNSAAQIAGNNILRLFKQWNIVISESGPGEALVAAVVAQFVNNLTGQNLDIARARAIVLDQFTQGANSVPYLDPFLKTPVPQGYPIYGPSGFQRVFQIVEQRELNKGFDPTKADQTTWHLMLQYAPLKWLFRVYIGHQPGQPVPPVPPLPPPPPPPPPPPVTPTQGDPDGDEITNTLCQQIGQNAQAIVDAINNVGQVGQAGGGGASPDCCTSVVTAIGGVSSALATIAGALPGLGAGEAPPDLTPITEALAELVAAVQAIPGAPDLTPIVTAINELTAATQAGDEAIVNALDGTPVLPPDPREKVAAFVQYLVANYAFDSGEAQIVQA